MTNARTIHADWLRTFRDLEAYTNGFTEPMQGKTQDWFLAGPLVSRTWAKNAAWAKAMIPRKHHAGVTPGILYATAFSGYQMTALEEIQPELTRCWQLCVVGVAELERIENLQK